MAGLFDVEANFVALGRLMRIGVSEEYTVGFVAESLKNL